MNLPFYFSYTGASALEIRQRAEELYRTAKYNCSEAVMSALRDAFFPDLPEYVIAATSGFPVGMGGAGCSCGAVNGGLVALGLLFGRSQPKDLLQSGFCMNLSRELHDTFKERNKTLCCRLHTKDMQIGSKEHSVQCTRYTGGAAEITATIIIREIASVSGETNQSTLSADSKVTEILMERPEAAEVFQRYGMTCLAFVIANEETLRVAVTHKNLPLEDICRDIGISP